jgi:EamA domain-containing membrane protein RarD
MPSSVLFPTHNGSVILVTAVAGALFFKEKLSTRQYISILVGINGAILGDDMYIFVKVIVSGVVFVWNFVARKVTLFK